MKLANIHFRDLPKFNTRVKILRDKTQKWLNDKFAEIIPLFEPRHEQFISDVGDLITNFTTLDFF